MKATELRIGNLVEYKFSNTGFQNVEFTLKDFRFGFEENINRYRPIPLTEEWLLKFGFISNPYKDRYEFGDIDVECDKTKGKTELWLAGSPHIKHVHQLQNLYFALTGKELTYEK